LKTFLKCVSWSLNCARQKKSNTRRNKQYIHLPTTAFKKRSSKKPYNQQITLIATSDLVLGFRDCNIVGDSSIPEVLERSFTSSTTFSTSNWRLSTIPSNSFPASPSSIFCEKEITAGCYATKQLTGKQNLSCFCNRRENTKFLQRNLENWLKIKGPS
jgi:hypothetical protein